MKSRCTHTEKKKQRGSNISVFQGIFLIDVMYYKDVSQLQKGHMYEHQELRHKKPRNEYKELK